MFRWGYGDVLEIDMATSQWLRMCRKDKPVPLCHRGCYSCTGCLVILSTIAVKGWLTICRVGVVSTAVVMRTLAPHEGAGIDILCCMVVYACSVADKKGVEADNTQKGYYNPPSLHRTKVIRKVYPCQYAMSQKES